MSQKLEIIDRILKSLAEHPEVETKETFQVFKNSIYREYKISKVISSIAFIERYNELIEKGELSYDIRIHKLLRKRAIRSLSGVSVISLLTKFWGCPGKCIYCPTNENLPKSYIPNEPAVMRAELNAFDPVRQVQNRLRSLEITGHTIDKCDVRIIGGTWSFYPRAYQEEFIKGIYDAHTNYSTTRKHIAATSIESEKFASFRLEKGYEQYISATLEEAKKRNETADSRVIGIAIETRPDWITPEEIVRLRSYGITRVEIGYQTTFDDINELNKRGHGNAESIRATRFLKDAGFKVVAHMMPNLLGSTPEMDIASLARVFDDPDFRPDELKIYPMVVTPNSELTDIWKNGGFKAYNDEVLVDLMARMQGMIPEYVRLNRMYRDIPASEILEGSKLANLRQVTDGKMKELGVTRKDISAREIRLKENNPENAILDVQKYEASGGIEYFLQYIDTEDRTLFSLLRLRVPSFAIASSDSDPKSKDSSTSSGGHAIVRHAEFISASPPKPDPETSSGGQGFLPELDGAAIVRELHTFGDQLKIGEKSDGTGQHMGFGKRLMAKAEQIILTNHPEIKKIAVIAGVGVRGYYAKLGYELVGEYMVKNCNL